MKPSAKIVLLCLGVFLPVSCLGLSINASEIVANATVKSANVTAVRSSNMSEPSTEQSKRFLPFILPLVFRFNRTRANQTTTTARPMVNATMAAGNKTVVKREIDNSTLGGFNVTQMMEQHGIRSNSSKLMQRLAARFNATSLNISALNETLLHPKREANTTTAAPHEKDAVLLNLTAALNESLTEKKEDRRSIAPLSNITRDASALFHSLPDLVSNATASATANLQSLPSLVANATASASANIHNLPSLVSNMTANVTSWAMKMINGGETAVNNETLTAAANSTRFTRASTHNSTLKGNNATRHNSTHKPGKLNRTIDSVLANEKRLAATVNLTLDGDVPAVKSSNISSNVTKTDFKRAATNLTLDTTAVKSNVTATKSDIKRPAANAINITGDVPAAKLMKNDSLTNSTLNRARRQEPTNDDIATRSRYGAPPPVYAAYTTTTQAPVYQAPVQYAPPAVPVYAAPQQQQTYSVPAPVPTYAPAYAPVSESYYTAPPAPITAAPYAPYAAQQPAVAQQAPMGAYGVPQQPPMASYAAPQQPSMAQQQPPCPYSAPPATYAPSAGRPTEVSPWL